MKEELIHVRYIREVMITATKRVEGNQFTGEKSLNRRKVGSCQ